jgi:hypothetical protein
MSNTISLEGSIRTCKIDAGWAQRLQSDRFLNSNIMLCPPWNGVDTSGRPVCWDSYWTKDAGCSSAADRVIVENALRPQYMEYVNLDAAGLRGGSDCNTGEVYSDTVCHQNYLNQKHKLTGQFGLQTGFSQNIMPSCTSCRSMPDPRADSSQSMRDAQFRGLSWDTFRDKQRGFF